MNNSNQWAVLFDLDETLVMTSALEPLRRSRKWTEVYKSFDLTSLPPETLEFLARIEQKAIGGIVTKSPRSYAEQLLRHHGIQLPVLAAYHDVRKVKPDPEALLLASKRVGISPERSIYVGDDANDVMAAKSAQFTPVGVCWGQRVEIGLPKVCCSWREVEMEIDQLICK
jgi:HAD superfamily hydrolase (TIGR01549 family)